MTKAGADKIIAAAAIAVLIAQIVGLPGYPLAGIVAFLAVRAASPLTASVSLRLAAGGVLGALLGVFAGQFGAWNGILAGLAVLVTVVILAWAGWSEALPVSAASALTAAAASAGLGIWDAAWKMAAAALIGVGSGLLVGLIYKPARQLNTEMIEEKSERMIRALLHFIILDLETKRIMRPPIVDEQMREISEYIRRGRQERERERKFRKMQGIRSIDVYQVLEAMLARIGDMVRVLVQNPLEEEDYVFSIKMLKLITRFQERVARGKRLNLAVIRRALERKRAELRQDAGDGEGLYHLCTLALDYLVELERLNLELKR